MPQAQAGVRAISQMKNPEGLNVAVLSHTSIYIKAYTATESEKKFRPYSTVVA